MLNFMGQYIVTIFAQHGITVIPIYCVVHSALTIVDAHNAGEKMVARFNAHRPSGTSFFVLVSDAG